MASFFCPQGGGYKEFWLDVSEMIKENAAMSAFFVLFLHEYKIRIVLLMEPLKKEN